MNSLKFTFAFTLFIVTILFWGLTSCAQQVTGNGNVVTQERTITPFTHLTVNGVFNLFINQGDKEAVKVETDENLQSIIETINKDNTLTIKWKDKPSVKKSTKMNIYVTIRDLKSIDIDAVGSFSTISTIQVENMKLKISGVGNIFL